MSDQDRYIPGVPCWIDTNQPDPEAAAAFYGGLFGWEFDDVTPPGAPVRYLAALLRGERVAGVASQPAGSERPVAWDTYVWVTDADETAAKVRDGGRERAERARSTSATPAGRRCAPIPTGPSSACGSRTGTAARRSSTSTAR